MKPPKKNKQFTSTATTKIPVSMEMEKERSMLCVNEKDLKAVKDWQVGKKYKLIVDAEMTGVNKSEYGDKSVRVEFRINKIKSE
jgi:hypothetical protein